MCPAKAPSLPSNGIYIDWQIISQSITAKSSEGRDRMPRILHYSAARISETLRLEQNAFPRCFTALTFLKPGSTPGTQQGIRHMD